MCICVFHVESPFIAVAWHTRPSSVGLDVDTWLTHVSSLPLSRDAVTLSVSCPLLPFPFLPFLSSTCKCRFQNSVRGTVSLFCVCVCSSDFNAFCFVAETCVRREFVRRGFLWSRWSFHPFGSIFLCHVHSCLLSSSGSPWIRLSACSNAEAGTVFVFAQLSHYRGLHS